MNMLIQVPLFVLGLLLVVLVVITPLLIMIFAFKKKQKKHQKIKSRKAFDRNGIKGSGNTQGYGNTVHYSDKAELHWQYFSQREKELTERYEQKILYMYDQLLQLREENMQLKIKLELSYTRIPLMEVRFPDTQKLTG